MPTRQTERDDIDRDRTEERLLKHPTGDGRPTSNVPIFDDIKVELKADRQAAAGVDPLCTRFNQRAQRIGLPPVVEKP
jgi:hypothetical protein